MTKLGKNLLRKLLLRKDGRWYDGNTVTIHYDLDVDKFCVMSADDNTLDIRERYFNDVDSALMYFFSIYNNERIFNLDI